MFQGRELGECVGVGAETAAPGAPRGVEVGWGEREDVRLAD